MTVKFMRLHVFDRCDITAFSDELSVEVLFHIYTGWKKGN